MTHWKKLTNPNYLGAYALEKGQELIATIDYVREETVVGADGKKEDCVVAHFKETNIKPMILNATNMKMITKIYKTPYIENWSGKKIQIYVDQVKAFGEVVEALRIKPIIPKTDVYICEECGKEIKSSGKFEARDIALNTQKKYGKMLCVTHWEAMKKAAESSEEKVKE